MKNLNFNAIGLSKVDEQVYKLLLKKRLLRVSKIADALHVWPSSLYRVLDNLERQGFVTAISGYPKYYQARDLDEALESYLNYQKSLVEKMKSKPKPPVAAKPKMQILTGRKEIFETYMNLTKQAEKDMLTISIGEKVPEELYKTTKKAIDRGVINYLIFQKHNRENDLWLKRWQALGSKVRILPGEGYHLNIIDDKYTIISVSNPKNTKERTAVLITSPTIVVELRKYFFQQWQQAKKLESLRGGLNRL